MLIRRIARPMLSAVFIGRGVDALRSPKPAADAARPTLDGLSKLPEPVSANVPSDAETVARATAAVQIGGGVLLAAGKMPRLASAALAFSVIPGSLGSHAFWDEDDPQRKADERRAFLTDVSLIGGLIIAASDTAGRPSLGWRGRRAAQRVLPSGSGSAGAGAIADSEFADKVGHGLQVGAERGRELANLARERAPELAETARARGLELAEVARERGPVLAEAARQRGVEFAEVARERAPQLAETARERAPQLAETARERAPQLAETARERGPQLAEVARQRAPQLAEAARERGPVLAEAARQRGPQLAEAARRRAPELAEVARGRADEVTGTARKQAKKQAEKQQTKKRRLRR